MIRRFIFWLLVLAFLLVVVTKFGELKALVATLAGASWQWLAAAAVFQAIFYLGFASSYQSAFHCVDIESRLRDLIMLLLAAEFVDVLTPWGGAAGLALIVDDTTRRGHPAARATAGLILQLVADFAALTLILVAGMIYLSLTHHLEIYVIVGACILLLITLGMGAALLLGLWKPVVLRRLLTWFQNLLNFIARRFKRPNFLAEDWAEEFSCEYIAASSALRCYPNRLARTLGTMLVVHASSIACLYILFLAFYQSVNLDILLAGYSVEFVFWIISLIPQGIGIVEGSMVLVFTSLGVPLDAAVVVSVAFRGMTFWLPLGLGFLSLRRIKTFEGV